MMSLLSPPTGQKNQKCTISWQKPREDSITKRCCTILRSMATKWICTSFLFPWTFSLLFGLCASVRWEKYTITWQTAEGGGGLQFNDSFFFDILKMLVFMVIWANSFHKWFLDFFVFHSMWVILECDHCASCYCFIYQAWPLICSGLWQFVHSFSRPASRHSGFRGVNKMLMEFYCFNFVLLCIQNMTFHFVVVFSCGFSFWATPNGFKLFGVVHVFQSVSQR